MAHDILGDWELALGEAGRGVPLGRFRFFEHGGRLCVSDADPDDTDAIARVEVTGDVLRFEHLGGGSARGTTRHTFELRLRGASELTGTRRRGLLAKVPLTGVRVTDPTDAISHNLVEAKARAAQAAERASHAAAEAAAALAEAEAAAAIEVARRAAQKAVAARAAASGAAGHHAHPLLSVPPEVLAVIPPPAAPSVPAPHQMPA